MSNSRRLVSVCLAAVMLAPCSGCQLRYDIHLSGRLLAGPDQSPVHGAVITVDDATCNTDSNGEWQLELTIMQGHVKKTSKGVVPDGDEYNIRIEFDGQELTVPFPTFQVPKKGIDIYCSVLMVVNAEAVPQSPSAPTIQQP